MPDFTSALFLDRRHDSAGLGGWPALTSGRPAAAEESSAAAALGRRVARAHGAAAGVVHRSALHALVDVVSLLARPGTVVLLDRAAYPLARTAALAVGGTVPVSTFSHHDGPGLVAAADRSRRRPVVVTDGWCAGCNRPAPLPGLERVARDRGGVLVVDDTQAAGVLGGRAARHPPFGRGGGGTFRWLGAAPGGAVQVLSLAKAYGAPLAVTTGPARVVGRLAAYGTRWSASPPSAADLAAAVRATADEADNDRRRDVVAGLVLRLRRGLRRLGLAVAGLAFPVVTVLLGGLDAATALHRWLVRGGVGALLLRATCLRRPAIAFAVTARHVEADIDEALAVLDAARRERAAVR